MKKLMRFFGYVKATDLSGTRIIVRFDRMELINSDVENLRLLCELMGCPMPLSPGGLVTIEVK